MMKRCNLILLLSFFTLLSCSRGEVSIHEALLFAGENKQEMKTVLSHYREEDPDHEKYEAARFLISNMPFHRSYEPQAYREYCDSLIAVFTGNYDRQEMVRRANALTDAMRPSLRLVHDIRYLSSDYLIGNIDQAFDQWRNSPYMQHLSFEDMCEFVLPYKCFDGQPCDDWRSYAALDKDGELQQMQQIHEYRHVPRAAAEIVSRSLMPKVQGREYEVEGLKPVPTFDYRLLSVVPYSTCQDFTALDVIAQRASGVPVCTDITPNWPYMERPHFWNVVLNRNRLEIDYLALESLPGDWHYEDNRMAKAFRRTWSPNAELVKALRRGETLPGPFDREMFVRDVTTHYSNVLDLKVRLKKTVLRKRLAYLCVFNNQQWTPVDFAPSIGRRACFRDVGFDNAYIVALAGPSGNLEPVSDPFIFDCDGNVSYCTARNELQSITLTRKFIALWHIWRARERLRGGAIDSADKPDFSDAEQQALFPQDNILSVVAEISDTTSHRYWRFRSTKEDSTCVADLFFFIDGQIRDPRIHGGSGGKDYGSVLDKDALTHATIARDGYVGFDFGSEVRVEKVSCIRRGDGNDIFPGDTYELYAWVEDAWQFLGRKTAEDISIQFDDVPQGALCFIKCTTRGYQNRIFLYQDGQAVWY